MFLKIILPISWNYFYHFMIWELNQWEILTKDITGAMVTKQYPQYKLLLLYLYRYIFQTL